MESVRIRKASPGDAALIEDLLQRAYPALMSDAYSDEVLSAALPYMTRVNPELLKSGTYYVAEDSERILGCGGWTLERPGMKDVAPDLAHLRHFVTDPAFTRKGVGGAIFGECAGKASKAGAKRFQVYSSLNAVSFYESLGLIRIKQIDLPMSPAVSFPVMLMEGPTKVG